LNNKWGECVLAFSSESVMKEWITAIRSQIAEISSGSLQSYKPEKEIVVFSFYLI
jgi:hypothetical protein